MKPCIIRLHRHDQHPVNVWVNACDISTFSSFGEDYPTEVRLANGDTLSVNEGPDEIVGLIHEAEG
jgi:hypothetical protein